MKSFWLKLAFFAFLLGVGAAANAATLNKDVTLQNDVLTVGDVFTDAGENAGHVLGAAPKPGNVLVLNTKTLQRIAGSFAVDWKPERGTETASVRNGQPKASGTPLTGSVKIPVLAAPLKRDDVISASDLIWMEVPANKLRDDTALKEADLVGLSARGLIQPNEPVSTSLLVAPKMIKRGQMVTLSLSAGRITLTAKGKALHDARLGEIVRVENPDSQKILQAKVTGPQEAIIEPQS